MTQNISGLKDHIYQALTMLNSQPELTEGQLFRTCKNSPLGYINRHFRSTIPNTFLNALMQTLGIVSEYRRGQKPREGRFLKLEHFHDFVTDDEIKKALAKLDPKEVAKYTAKGILKDETDPELIDQVAEMIVEIERLKAEIQGLRKSLMPQSSKRPQSLAGAIKKARRNDGDNS